MRMSPPPLASLPPQILAVPSRISNYQGGSSPLLLIIISACICAIIIGAVLILFLRCFKVWKFNKLCYKRGITGEQLVYLTTHATRYKIPCPLSLITQKPAYDCLMNNVATFYSRDTITEDDFFKIAHLFTNIRTKLDLLYNPLTYHIRSSRAMHIGQPIQVIIIDEEINQTIPFSSRIIEISDLYIGILPPDEENEKHYRHRKRKPELEISFLRPKDTKYTFDSKLVRIIETPKHLWYIFHSLGLFSKTLHKELNIPATLLCPQSEDSDESIEYAGSLIELTNCQCSLIFEKELSSIAPDTHVLLSFSLNTILLTLRGQYTMALQEGRHSTHTITFANLDDDQFRIINKFIYSQKKQEKQKRLHEEELV